MSDQNQTQQTSSQTQQSTQQSPAPYKLRFQQKEDVQPKKEETKITNQQQIQTQKNINEADLFEEASSQVLEDKKKTMKDQQEMYHLERQVEMEKQRSRDSFFESLSPELREEFESKFRKEQMMRNKIETQKSCTTCKLVSGSLFLGAGALHGYRVSTIWSFYPLREKFFNIFAVGILLGIAGLNYKAAADTYMGKSLQVPIEYRPSVGRRLSESFNILSGGSQKNIEQQLRMEEEKMEISRHIQEKQQNNL